MSSGIKDYHKKAIIDTLSANERVEQVVLFGSRAMGSFAMTSDIDLALFGDQLTRSDLAKLTSAMKQLSVPQQVDLVLYHGIQNEKLLEHIQKHGVEWYRRDK